jgi:hypothetical protein
VKKAEGAITGNPEKKVRTRELFCYDKRARRVDGPCPEGLARNKVKLPLELSLLDELYSRSCYLPKQAMYLFHVRVMPTHKSV